MNLLQKIISFYRTQNNSKRFDLNKLKKYLIILSFSAQVSDDSCTIHYSYDKEDDIDEDEDEDLNL